MKPVTILEGVAYQDCTVDVHITKYTTSPHPYAIFLTPTGSQDENVAVGTVFHREVPPTPNHVLIKNYAENEGILDWLVEHGIVEMPDHWVPMGFTSAAHCALTATVLEKVMEVTT